MGFTRGESVDVGTDDAAGGTGDAVVGKTKTTAGAGYEWIDGGIAGSILGAVISGFSKFLSKPFFPSFLLSKRPTSNNPTNFRSRFPSDRFPTPLFARTVLLGTTFGALEGCLRIAQDTIGRLKEESELQKAEEEKRAAAKVDSEEGTGAERSGEVRIKSV
jgi:hypothetical protein